MKISEIKKIMKEALREVIKEELTNLNQSNQILLEVIKTQNQMISSKTNIKESLDFSSKKEIDESKKIPNIQTFDMRNKYASVLNETIQQGITNEEDSPQSFRPAMGNDLGVGEIGMDQIMSLMSK